MTEALDPKGFDILQALQKDACVPAPRAARQRVAARLVAAGVVTAVSSGSVSSAASPGAVSGSDALNTGASSASAAAAPGATVVSLAGAISGTIASSALVKTLLVGIVIGAGIGLGAYAVRRYSAPEADRAATGTTPRSNDGSAPPEQRPRVVNPEPPAAAPPATISFEELDLAAEPAREPVRGAFAELRTAGTANTVKPSPEPPRLASKPSASRLGEQQTLLDEARAALRAGDAALALTALARHRTTFPETAFDEERRALEIRALVATGNVETARARLATFERRFGQSLQLSSLQRIVVAADENVTGSASSAKWNGHEDGAN